MIYSLSIFNFWASLDNIEYRSEHHSINGSTRDTMDRKGHTWHTLVPRYHIMIEDRTSCARYGASTLTKWCTHSKMSHPCFMAHRGWSIPFPGAPFLSHVLHTLLRCYIPFSGALFPFLDDLFLCRMIFSFHRWSVHLLDVPLNSKCSIEFLEIH